MNFKSALKYYHFDCQLLQKGSVTINLIKKIYTMQQIQVILNRGGLITFEPGIYKITRQLILPSSTQVNLNGAVLRRTGNIQSIFINKVSSKTTGYQGSGKITIENGTLEGMGGFQYDNTLTLFHSNNVLLNNIKFLDCCGSHSVEVNACSNIIIRNCSFLGYNSNPKATFREQIQIDFAGYSEFVLSGTTKTSKCYDGTHCKNITIENCIFDKSSSRPGCNAAIGNHAACSNGKRHIGIKIRNNKIKGYGIDKNQCGINLTSMQDVSIEKNHIEGFGRAIRIFAPAYFYTPKGQKIVDIASSGFCKNITISNNTILANVGKLKSSGIYSYCKSNSEHQNIMIRQNTFSGNKTARDAVNLTNVVYASIQSNKSNGKLQYRSSNAETIIKNNN